MNLQKVLLVHRFYGLSFILLLCLVMNWFFIFLSFGQVFFLIKLFLKAILIFINVFISFPIL